MSGSSTTETKIEDTNLSLIYHQTKSNCFEFERILFLWRPVPFALGLLKLDDISFSFFSELFLSIVKHIYFYLMQNVVE